MIKGKSTYLNVPYEIVKAALLSRELLDALELAVYIKQHYVSSVYKKRRRSWVSQISCDLHRSHEVARRIYKNALKSGLIAEKGNTLVAVSFVKTPWVKTTMKTNLVGNSKIKNIRIKNFIFKQFNHKDMVEEFRKMLFICVVRDKKYNQLRPIYPLSKKGMGGFSYADILTSTDERGQVKLSIRQIATMLGMKKSSTENLVQKIEREGEVFRVVPGLHYVGTVDEVCMAENISYEQLVCRYLVFEKDGLVYKNPSCLYSVVEKPENLYSTGFIYVNSQGRRIKSNWFNKKAA